MLFASVNGVNLYYDRLGNGDPLVLIHGLGERKEGWKFQHELAEHFDLIIPDLRGFGKTRCSESQEITINAFARDIVELLEQLGLNEAHILGFSMGGMVAQEIYKIRPEKIKSLILANTLFYVPKWLKKLLLRTNKKFTSNLTIEKFHTGATSRCLHDKNEEAVQKVMPIWSEHLDGFLPGVNACLEIDYRQTLKKMNVPTLVISCQNDRICPPFNQKRMHKLIPNSKFYTIKKAGHVGKIEKTDEFNHVVLHFLTSVSA
ncbi:alpha/beta fold hydrolase [Neobacillus sp. GCM10023253]|uniref:alpha/beta fold hydrolase n=1 Tax=Neobacillus sp. GCM10023253 TaxID=3252644 RepID=UPI003621AB6E